MIYFPFELFIFATAFGVFISCPAFIFFFNFVNFKYTKDKESQWKTSYSVPMTHRGKNWNKLVVTV